MFRCNHAFQSCADHVCASMEDLPRALRFCSWGRWGLATSTRAWAKLLMGNVYKSQATQEGSGVVNASWNHPPRMPNG